jgi:hypothetical protein
LGCFHRCNRNTDRKSQRLKCRSSYHRSSSVFFFLWTLWNDCRYEPQKIKNQNIRWLKVFGVENVCCGRELYMKLWIKKRKSWSNIICESSEKMSVGQLLYIWPLCDPCSGLATHLAPSVQHFSLRPNWKNKRCSPLVINGALAAAPHSPIVRPRLSFWNSNVTHTHRQTDMCVQTLKKSGDWEYHIYTSNSTCFQSFIRKDARTKEFSIGGFEMEGGDQISGRRVVRAWYFSRCFLHVQRRPFSIFFFFFFVTDSDCLSPGFSLKITQYNLLLEISFLG